MKNMMSKQIIAIIEQQGPTANGKRKRIKVCYLLCTSIIIQNYILINLIIFVERNTDRVSKSVFEKREKSSCSNKMPGEEETAKQYHKICKQIFTYESNNICISEI